MTFTDSAGRAWFVRIVSGAASASDPTADATTPGVVQSWLVIFERRGEQRMAVAPDRDPRVHPSDLPAVFERARVMSFQIGESNS
ncbi:MAG TPA: hypothetical protein VGD77_06750 [Gemmatimonadaceae bacterium]